MAALALAVMDDRTGKWCSRMESNHRPPPYQGGALPTELRERVFQPSSMTAKNRPASCRTFSTRASPLHGTLACDRRPAGLFNKSLSMERETGIEPALVAWKATVLPLNYSRAGRTCLGAAPTTTRSSGGASRRIERSVASFESNRSSMGGSNPPHETVSRQLSGGGRWIRTTEGVSQQIYSLPPLAAWVSLQKLVFHVPACLAGRWITSGILPSALRATPLARRVSLPSRSRALSVHGDASVKAAK